MNFAQPFVCARVSVCICACSEPVYTFNSCDYWMRFPRMHNEGAAIVRTLKLTKVLFTRIK